MEQVAGQQSKAGFLEPAAGPWAAAGLVSTILLVCLLAPAQVRAAKAGRPSEGRRTASAVLVPDDPLMDHLLRKMIRSRPGPPGWGPGRQGPGLFLGYRLAAFVCQVQPCWYHQGLVMVYPIALLEPESAVWRVLRFGLGLEGGREATLHPKRSWQHHQHAAGVLSFGFQYPWRVTSFLDFVVTLGAVHRNLYNKDFFDFAYSLGLDMGTSVFLLGRFHVTGSLGWRRWVVRSKMGDLYVDSLSVTMGLGF